MSLVDHVLEQLQEQGYALLKEFITEHQLEMLRTECEVMYELAQEGQQGGACGGGGSRWGMESRASCIYEGVPGHLCTPPISTCYYIYKLHRTRPPLGDGVWGIMFRSQLPELILRVLGPDAVLFNDQYIIKPPLSPLSSFRWHRDSDWCRNAEVHHRPYVSVWIALDDMMEDNGCFVVKPGSHLRSVQLASDRSSDGPGASGTDGCNDSEEQQEGQQHTGESRCSCGGSGCLHAVREASERGQEGEQEALPLCVRAGTAIITSDTVLHCSGPNHSRHTRRAWMPQFSAGPITWRAGGQPVGLAIPLRPPADAATAAALAGGKHTPGLFC